MKSANIVRNFKPHAVVGTGGFASGPLLKVASGKGIPCVLQEQNSFAGITNKLLANKVAKICVAYDGMEKFFPKDKIVKTGNPVRGDLVAMSENKVEAMNFFGLQADKTTLLVLGGSLGARRVNVLIEQSLPLFKEQGIQVIWQSGKLYYEEYKKYESGDVKVVAFLNRMDLAYGAADIIISRAGAGSVSELCIVGRPVIFIPSPNVAEDHQTKNAQSLVEKDAAIMVRETELDEKFESVFLELIRNKDLRGKLGANIKNLAMPNATKEIVNEIEKLLVQQ